MAKKDKQAVHFSNVWVEQRSLKYSLLVAMAMLTYIAVTYAIDSGSIWWHAVAVVSAYIFLRVVALSLLNRRR